MRAESDELSSGLVPLAVDQNACPGRIYLPARRATTGAKSSRWGSWTT
jgi:hypothetical protein